MFGRLPVGPRAIGGDRGFTFEFDIRNDVELLFCNLEATPSRGLSCSPNLRASVVSPERQSLSDRPQWRQPLLFIIAGVDCALEALTEDANVRRTYLGAPPRIRLRTPQMPSGAATSWSISHQRDQSSAPIHSLDRQMVVRQP